MSDPKADHDAGLTEEDVEKIRARYAAIIDRPPIRWGRYDAVVLIKSDIPALLAEVARLRMALQAQNGSSDVE